MHETRQKFHHLIVLFCFALLTLIFHSAAAAENEIIPITVHFSNVTDILQTITVDYCDDWLLQPDDIYNHKLMQASYAMAVAGFRSKVYDLGEKDHDILEFFHEAGFIEPRSDDFNKLTGIDTIGTLIAHKKVGNTTLVGISISGNNYNNEWLSNLTIDNEVRPAGFNNASQTVMRRLDEYIDSHNLSGDVRIWVAGYSLAAAVSNIFAADATESKRFSGVYAYTFATPRTTREANSDKYQNIFNLINPDDVVPLVPFPEWGYERYGQDLYLPSVSTNSRFNHLYTQATQTADFDIEDLPVFNPRIRRQLHTFLDYIAYFVNSADTYARSIQNIMLDYWQKRDLKTLFSDILQNIRFSSILRSIVRQGVDFNHRVYEYYNFFDFISGTVYSSFVAHQFESESDYWDGTLTLQENIAYGHYDKSYRFWLFSTDDPNVLFSNDPTYLHYTIVGDINVEVLDEVGDMVYQFDNEGSFILNTEDPYNPDFHGKVSDVILYMERNGDQTMIELPGDQMYTIYIRSNVEQEIQASVVEYAADRLKSEVLYIYQDHYDKNEGYPEKIDPKTERLITDEILETVDGVQTSSPWNKDIDYSPTVIMKLDNAGIFLPKSLPIMFLVQIFVNQLLALIFIGVIKIFSGTTIFIRKKVFGIGNQHRTDQLEPPQGKIAKA